MNKRRKTDVYSPTKSLIKILPIVLTYGLIKIIQLSPIGELIDPSIEAELITAITAVIVSIQNVSKNIHK